MFVWIWYYLMTTLVIVYKRRVSPKLHLERFVGSLLRQGSFDTITLWELGFVESIVCDWSTSNRSAVSKTLRTTVVPEGSSHEVRPPSSGGMDLKTYLVTHRICLFLLISGTLHNRGPPDQWKGSRNFKELIKKINFFTLRGVTFLFNTLWRNQDEEEGCNWGREKGSRWGRGGWCRLFGRESILPTERNDGDGGANRCG